jgi:RecA/RadA recombinase
MEERDVLDDVIESIKVEKPVKPAKRKTKTEEPKEELKEEPKEEIKKSTFVDNRKLTTKGKELLRAKWSVENSFQSRDGLMQGLLEAGRSKFGAERVFGSRKELEQLAIGIPTPSLAFEYLIANDVFPLSSVMMLAGSWGSCKSALSYEFFRWFYELSGLAVHIDTENKFDAEFACDIMGVDRDATPIISNRANSVEQMQDLLTHYLMETQKMLIGSKEEPGPGKTVPCCFCIDSLAAATSEEIQEKITKEGHANRAHPVNALKNTHYLAGIKKQFENWPFTLLVVNHLKEKIDDMGNTQQYTLGGQSFNFHESFEIRNSIWKAKFKNAQFEGVGVRLHCAKNSFGPTGRKIKTRFLWWIEDDATTGEPRDVFLWDWNWAICTLLNEMDGIQKQRLLDRDLGIKCKSPAADVECLANFRAVGMGKDEYLPFQEVGQMIQDNPAVCKQIREALNIKQRYRLDRPYDDLINKYKESAN